MQTAAQKANRAGLLDYWRTGAQLPGVASRLVGGLEWYHNRAGGWPNYGWFQDEDALEIRDARQSLDSVKSVSGLQVCAFTDRAADMIREAGWKGDHGRTGMYFEMDEAVGQPRHEIQFYSPADVFDGFNIWSRLFESSFSYPFSPDAARATYPAGNPLLIQYQGEFVGTVAAPYVAATQTLGIYSLGISKAHRGRGLASDALRHLLRNAPAATRYTLQAAAGAQGLYERLGFRAHFQLRFFRYSE